MDAGAIDNTVPGIAPNEEDQDDKNDCTRESSVQAQPEAMSACRESVLAADVK